MDDQLDLPFDDLPLLPETSDIAQFMASSDDQSDVPPTLPDDSLWTPW